MNSTLLTTVLNTSVSIFRSKDSRDIRDVTIGAVLKAFKSEKYAETVKEARRILDGGDEAGYKAKKGELPVVTFSGTFAGGHGKKNLKQYSYVVVLDIDDLAEDDLTKAQKCLAADEYVFSYWKSPSNQGLKGLVYLEYNYEGELNECHNNAFDQLEKHFLEYYGITLDGSGSDYSRLCFACWDNELVLKTEVVPFPVLPPAKKERKKPIRKAKVTEEVTEEKLLLVGVHNIKGRNSIRKRNEIEAIIRYLKRHNKSITYSYQDWLEVGFAIVNSFNPDLGKKYFLKLSALDTDKFDEADCLRMLDNCYKNARGSITFGTLLYKAQQQGYESMNK